MGNPLMLLLIGLMGSGELVTEPRAMLVTSAEIFKPDSGFNDSLTKATPEGYFKLTIGYSDIYQGEVMGTVQPPATPAPNGQAAANLGGKGFLTFDNLSMEKPVVRAYLLKGPKGIIHTIKRKAFMDKLAEAGVYIPPDFHELGNPVVDEYFRFTLDQTGIAKVYFTDSAMVPPPKENETKEEAAKRLELSYQTPTRSVLVQIGDENSIKAIAAELVADKPKNGVLPGALLYRDQFEYYPVVISIKKQVSKGAQQPPVKLVRGYYFGRHKSHETANGYFGLENKKFRLPVGNLNLGTSPAGGLSFVIHAESFINSVLADQLKPGVKKHNLKCAGCGDNLTGVLPIPKPKTAQDGAPAGSEEKEEEVAGLSFTIADEGENEDDIRADYWKVTVGLLPVRPEGKVVSHSIASGEEKQSKWKTTPP